MLITCKLYNSWGAGTHAGVRIDSPSGGYIWLPRDGWYTFVVDPTMTVSEHGLMWRITQKYRDLSTIGLTVEEMKMLVRIARKYLGSELKIHNVRVGTPSANLGKSIY